MPRRGGCPRLTCTELSLFEGGNDKGGIANLTELDEIVLKGRIDGKLIAREVWLVFDSDWVEKDGVYDALVRLTAALTRRGARVRIVELPCQLNGDKMGLDDFFAGGGTLEEFKHLIRGLPTKPSAPRLRNSAPSKRKSARASALLSVIDGQLSEVLKEFFKTINKANAKNPDFPVLYRGAGGFTIVERDLKGQISLNTANANQLQWLAGEVAIWYGSRGEIFPPKSLMDIFLASHARFSLPAIARVMSAPFTGPTELCVPSPVTTRQPRPS